MRAALVVLAAALAVAGCGSSAARHRPPGVPVDSRPSPPATAPVPEGERPAAEPASPPPVPVESVMTPDERRATLTRIVADTTAAGDAVRRCGSRKLLPDQESVFETTRSLLEQTRAALARSELWRAESLARKARQLAASLDCPG
jgi:hypothetical protein